MIRRTGFGYSSYLIKEEEERKHYQLIKKKICENIRLLNNDDDYDNDNCVYANKDPHYIRNLMKLLSSAVGNDMIKQKQLYSKTRSNIWDLEKKRTKMLINESLREITLGPGARLTSPVKQHDKRLSEMKQIIQLDYRTLALAYKKCVRLYNLESAQQGTFIWTFNDVGSIHPLSKHRIAVISKHMHTVGMLDIEKQHDPVYRYFGNKMLTYHEVTSNIEVIDDKYYAYGMKNGSIKVFDSASLEQYTKMKHRESIKKSYGFTIRPIKKLKYMKETNTMISITTCGDVRLWRCDTFSLIKSIRIDCDDRTHFHNPNIIYMPATQRILIYAFDKIFVYDNKLETLHTTTNKLPYTPLSYLEPLGLIFAMQDQLCLSLVDPETFAIVRDVYSDELNHDELYYNNQKTFIYQDGPYTALKSGELVTVSRSNNLDFWRFKYCSCCI